MWTKGELVASMGGACERAIAIAGNASQGRKGGVEDGKQKVETHRKVLHRIRQDLGPPRRDGRVRALRGPFGRVDAPPEDHGGVQAALIKDVSDRGKAVFDDGLRYTEGTHDARGEDRSAPCVRETQEAFERRDKLQSERTEIVDGGDGHLLGVEQLYERGDRISGPLEQVGKYLWKTGASGKVGTWNGKGGSDLGRLTFGLKAIKYLVDRAFMTSGSFHARARGRIMFL